jgi:hypothetical protein
MYVKKKNRGSKVFSLQEIKDDMMIGVPLNSKEIDYLERFSSLIPAKIQMLKKDILRTFIIPSGETQYAEILDDLKIRLDSLGLMLSEKQFRDMIIKTQCITKDKVLFPGIGACHIEKGIISTFIVDIRMLSHILTVCLGCNITEIKSINEHINELHLLFTPDPKNY